MANVLIVGATSAIACATAKLFARQGHTLYLMGRDPGKLEAVAADLQVRTQRSVRWSAFDFNEFSKHQAEIDRAHEVLGKIDIALVAHGTLPVQKRCERDFNLVLHAVHDNFLSQASLLLVLADRMESQRRGTIVVITSVAADRGRRSNYVYGAAKAGLSAFASGLRCRLAASGVRVVEIKPGLVDTPMTAGLKKSWLFASPECIARGIARAAQRGPATAYLPWFWKPIMRFISILPERVFVKLPL